MSTFSRSFPLLDYSIRSGGDGRTVEMYAALWDVKTQISDRQGQYIESLDRNSFNETIKQRGTRFSVFYNHARTIAGTPSDIWSVPVATPAEPPRVDARGLVTVSRYDTSPEAERILEAIKNGALTSQSFGGRFLRSTPQLPPGALYKPKRDGSLPHVVRQEVAMTEWGPTPIPAYDEPMLVGVRSLVEQIDELDDDAISALARRLSLATAERADTPEDGAVEAEEPQQHSGRHLTTSQMAAIKRIRRS